jgi:hypothetical protein
MDADKYYGLTVLYTPGQNGATDEKEVAGPLSQQRAAKPAVYEYIFPSK